MNDHEIVQQLLHECDHMVVAVTLDDGTPWAVPVHMVSDDNWVFEWNSKPTTVHSRAIAKRPSVALTVFSIAKDIGLYMKATAEALPDVRDADGRVRYRATVTKAWLNEQHIKRQLAL
jgi:nitroimidazol reductase NimA-like FMN-containing flavoprotein (pyridoxamine 5'-phosphate oxidase superfamily)